MKFIKYIPLLLFTLSINAAPHNKKVAQYLQDVSVTIKAKAEYNSSEGSGVLIIREVEGKKITFVWTAAHVVDNLRNIREIIDESGRPRKVVEFKDAEIVKELVEEGRRVGEIKMSASVVKYSNAETGHDLALLMVRAKDYGKTGARFYLDDKDPIIPIGTQLFHVGSLLGQMGANSMTTGIVSQVGRIIEKMEYDQTTVTAFPGSSGGGVFLTDGRYVGMLVRGAGEGFNLTVPIRRIISWTKKNKIHWAIDPEVKMPTMDEILELPVEDSGLGKKSGSSGKNKDFPYLIKVTPSLPKVNPLSLKGEFNFVKPQL